MSTSSDAPCPRRSGRIRSFSDMSRRDFMKHSTARQASDSSTIASSSQTSCYSLHSAPIPPFQSPASTSAFSQEPQESRPVATALNSHLFHDDEERTVIIVRGNRKLTGSLRKALEDNDDDSEDDLWF